jgi:hypothetical protein
METSEQASKTELQIVKELLEAAYEREVFYREERDKAIIERDQWKSECRYLAVYTGLSKDEYEAYLKEHVYSKGLPTDE